MYLLAGATGAISASATLPSTTTPVVHVAATGTTLAVVTPDDQSTSGNVTPTLYLLDGATLALLTTTRIANYSSRLAPVGMIGGPNQYLLWTGGKAWRVDATTFYLQYTDSFNMSRLRSQIGAVVTPAYYDSSFAAPAVMASDGTSRLAAGTSSGKATSAILIDPVSGTATTKAPVVIASGASAAPPLQAWFDGFAYIVMTRDSWGTYDLKLRRFTADLKGLDASATSLQPSFEPAGTDPAVAAAADGSGRSLVAYTQPNPQFHCVSIVARFVDDDGLASVTTSGTGGTMVAAEPGASRQRVRQGLARATAVGLLLRTPSRPPSQPAVMAPRRRAPVESLVLLRRQRAMRAAPSVIQTAGPVQRRQRAERAISQRPWQQAAAMVSPAPRR